MDTRSLTPARSTGDAAPFLARSRLFRDLDADLRARLARAARRTSAARGEIVCGPGRPADGVTLVVSGYVALSVQEKGGREKVVEICGPGESFGEDSLVGAGSALTARVASAAILVKLPCEAVLEAMDRDPGVARCVLRSLSRRVLRATEQVGGGATRPGLLRLACYLLREIAPSETGPASVTLAVPKRIVASLLGLSKETFSRLLASLSGRGLIEVRGRSIRVPHPASLVELCRDGGNCAGCGGCPRGAGWVA